MTTFADLYHPALGNVHIAVPNDPTALALYESHGWVLSAGGGPDPTPIDLTVGLGDLRYAKLGDIPTPGTATGDALRAAFDARYAAVQQAKLGKWYAALGGRNASPAQILCMGDSITQGSEASVITNRWQTVLQARLRGSLGITSGAALPFIPAFSDMVTPDPQVTRAGTVVASAWGFASRAANITDGTGSVTFTFTGSRCKVMFMRGGAGGVARVVIDGGAPVTLNTTGGESGGGKILDSGPLSTGTHTVVVTRDTSSGAGTEVLLEGLLTYAGDESSGLRVLDAGRFGATSGDQLQIPTWSSQSLAVAGGAGLGIYAYGTNDLGIGVPPATFKANAAAHIAALRQYGNLGSVVYMAMYKGGGRTDAAWDPYVTALRELADADADGVFLDLGTRMPDAPGPAADFANDVYGLFHDSLHPADRGHGWIADVLASTILPH